MAATWTPWSPRAPGGCCPPAAAWGGGGDDEVHGAMADADDVPLGHLRVPHVRHVPHALGVARLDNHDQVVVHGRVRLLPSGHHGGDVLDLHVREPFY